MAIVAHAHPFVIGVDTHARSHTLAILIAATGSLVDSAQFPATSAGMKRAIVWVARRTEGDLGSLWAIEGVATYGARIARIATKAGYPVVEAPRMDARAQRGTGKSDPLDARRIAAAALALDTTQLRHPRADDGVRAALRTLITAREHMTDDRTACVNGLTALLRVADLGVDARKPLTGQQIREVAAWRARSREIAEDVATATARAEAVRLAKRVETLDSELTMNHATLKALIESSKAAPLLEKTGIGPLTAAVVYAAWSHPGRVRDEAAFASLAGVSPIPASSGNTSRHRLNRGGDRRLNRALHMATVTRMVHDAETRAYVEKRRAEGLTNREIRRCLKRYLARQLFRNLNSLHVEPAVG
ncbi:IS110 family transposase [Nocardioides ferulae]|uniref:IS110 family transposase n=1 Tax=Nocardioides ferulae TaxID=2340821 RepID=UPI000EB5BDE2|nr:IS110 family transposase [Nocardioides ferulae]